MMFCNYNPTDKENRPTMLWMAGLFMIIVWTSFEAPYNFVMGYKTLEHNLWWDVIFCTVFLIDIALKVRGTLKLPQSSKLIEDKDKKLHELPYHKSLWFFVDIITALPYELIASAISNEDNHSLVAMIRLISLFRIIKLRPVIGVVDFLPKKIKIILGITGVMLAIHWIACGWMLLNPQPNLDPLTYYNVSLYWAVTTLTTVGYGDITPASNIARLYTMGVMLIGVASYGIIIGNFSRMIMLADRYNEERKEKLSNMNQFMRYYNIPMSLQREIFSFYNHLLNKKISDRDTQIVSDLPQALQNELQLYIKIKLIKNVHIFQNCSTPCLKLIANSLEQTFHSPNEYIIKKGDEGAEMFIINHGEVEVSTGEMIITELKAGQFFGEIALIEDTIRSADVISKSYCDLYIFKKDDFLKVIEKYPDLDEKFQETYKKRKSDKKVDTKKAA